MAYAGLTSGGSRTKELATTIRHAANAIRADSATVDVPGFEKSDRALEALALVFLVVMAFNESGEAHDGLLAGLTAAAWLPLLTRHRWPTGALLVVVVVECVHLATVPLTYPVEFNTIPVAAMVACYTLARQREWRTAWICGGAAEAVLLLAGILARPDELASTMLALDMVLGATALGVLVRSRHLRVRSLELRAIQAEHAAEDEARRQVTDERLRMARELHDVIAHHLALVNAQSGVAAYLVRTDPDAAAHALQDLTEHTRQALDELRATVGLLRQDDDAGEDRGRGAPTPGLAALPALVADHRASGLDVDLSVTGDPRELPALGDLAAFRIAQEALTNARKHAPGSVVSVAVQWDPDAVGLRVDNTRPPGVPLDHRGAGTGHGLVGMRERAHASHGQVRTGPTDDGGFRVTARLPLAHRTDHPTTRPIEDDT